MLWGGDALRAIGTRQSGGIKVAPDAVRRGKYIVSLCYWAQYIAML